MRVKLPGILRNTSHCPECHVKYADCPHATKILDGKSHSRLNVPFCVLLFLAWNETADSHCTPDCMPSSQALTHVMREGGNFVAKIFGGKDVQLLFTFSLRGPPALTSPQQKLQIGMEPLVLYTCKSNLIPRP